LEEGLFGEGSGVYERETVAWAPSILIRNQATASVVTRFWGVPPANLGVQYEGGDWFSFLVFLVGDSCAGRLDEDGNVLFPDGRVGTVGFGVAPPPPPPSSEAHPEDGPEERAAVGTVPWHRSAPSLYLESGDQTGPLSPEESAALEDAYGSSHTVSVSTATRVQATIAVWWPIALATVVVILALWFVMRRIRGDRLDAGVSRQH
jgi:hypothetical protein